MLNMVRFIREYNGPLVNELHETFFLQAARCTMKNDESRTIQIG